MHELLIRPLAPGATDALWIEMLVNVLLQELAGAGRGQCLRLMDLPRPLLEGVAGQLATSPSAGSEVYLVDGKAGPEPWRAGIHKVVERRNADVILLALFPPDLQLAAGDSVDISTFRAIDVGALPDRLIDSLRARIPQGLREYIGLLFDDLARRKWTVTDSAEIEYLATVAAQGSDDPAVLGGALYTLGLMPDFDLFARPDEFHHRLGQRNTPIVERLAGSAARPGAGTPLERILRLPAPDAAFRARLLAFFEARPLAEVRGWGQILAAEPEWRDLALDRWPSDLSLPPPTGVRIDIEPLKLATRREDGLPLLEAGTDVKLGWQTTPPPMDVTGLRHFRIEVLNSDRQVVWESALIKNTGGSARRQRTIKEKDLDLEDGGLYFFRVIALDEAGDPFKEQPLRDAQQPGDTPSTGLAGPQGLRGKHTNEGEDFMFLVEGEEPDEDVDPVANTIVGSYAEAELLSRWAAIAAGKEPASMRTLAVEWATPTTARVDTAMATIRFGLQQQYSLPLSQRLRALEARAFANPDEGGHCQVGFRASGDPEVTPLPLALPADLAAARRDVCAAIEATVLSSDPELGAMPVVALADLGAIRPAVERYVVAYRRWLDTGDPEALRLDVALVTLAETGKAALLAPTHPVRLLWLVQRHQLARTWAAAAAMRRTAGRSLVEIWQRALDARALPQLLVLDGSDGYIEAGVLPGGWGIYLPPRLRDPRALLGALRRRLGAGSAREGTATGAGALADRLALFLRQHPYVEVLTINVVDPGDGTLIRDALIDLEGRTGFPEVRYMVRLLADAPHEEIIGAAFRELLDPDSRIAAAAERLVSPGPSFLFPKLSWSRHRREEFVQHHELFPAHVTLLLDAFRLDLRVSRLDGDDRTSFVHGLVQDVPKRFVGRGNTFAWAQRPMPRGCPDLAETPGLSGMIAGLLLSIGSAQARVLAPQDETLDTVAVPQLILQPEDQSLLYSAHAASTWVLTLDAHLGLDYFDTLRRDDRPGYLLDFTPEFTGTGDRQLLLTTKVDDEVEDLLKPALSILGLGPERGTAMLLLEALRSLSGRLALRLLSAPSQAQGALGMALARLFLRDYGLLDTALIIPLDAHPELTRPADPAEPHLRGDLLLVSADVGTRSLDFLIVEAKCLAGVELGAATRQEIGAQLGASEKAIRAAFDPNQHDPDRLDRAVQSWRLGAVLAFYLDRAIRYELIAPDAGAELRRLFLDLDGGYQLAVRGVGIVFQQDAQGSYLDRTDPDTSIWVADRRETQRIIAAALAARSSNEVAQDAGEAHTSRPDGSPDMGMPRPDPDGPGDAAADHALVPDRRTLEAVRATFGGINRQVSPKRSREGSVEGEDARHLQGGSGAEDSPPVIEGCNTAPDLDGAGATLGKRGGNHRPAESGLRPPADAGVRAGPRGTGRETNRPDGTRPHPSASGDDTREQPAVSTVAGVPETLAFDVLLGDTVPTPQYGMLGTVGGDGRRVALDLNGCNTISLFGVQGSGKSYTVGSILEMALRPLPGLNVLPRPLGAVVFHYHQTQDYPPEFVSMSHPNDSSSQVSALAEWGAAPAAIEDVLVLTTEDKVDARRRDFPHAMVAPIAFSSEELSVADWRFLMGATGNDALYLKLLNEVMRRQRSNLTLAGIREGLSALPLSDSQRILAGTRLDFAARFIDDARSLRSLLRPGRMIIVDLRDEFVEREQALGLFVTMLNVFSGAGQGPNPFNKLIVFDEAHKYMGGALSEQVVGTIREMRHKGVSLLIASQDPVHVPPAIIELSSAVILHRFNAPSWLKHIQKALGPLAELTGPMLSALGPGEAYIWANKATDPTFTRRAVKVRLRPRATAHGGSTQTALPS